MRWIKLSRCQYAAEGGRRSAAVTLAKICAQAETSPKNLLRMGHYKPMGKATQPRETLARLLHRPWRRYHRGRSSGSNRNQARQISVTRKRILSVGQCGADHYAISCAIERNFDADILSADDADEALDLLKQNSFHLVLANRVFDRDGADGVAFVKRLKNDEKLSHVPIMLVSNYEDAQQRAVKAGAAPGFGKSSLGMPVMLQRLQPFLRDPNDEFVDELK